MKMRGRPSFLDRKQCFELWVELGSLPKVQQSLARKGVVNPKTGKPAGLPAIRAAAYKHVFYNIAEARKVYQRLGAFGEGKDEAWIEYLKNRAVQFLMTRYDRYDEWEQKYLNEYIKGLTEGN